MPCEASKNSCFFSCLLKEGLRGTGIEFGLQAKSLATTITCLESIYESQQQELQLVVGRSSEAEALPGPRAGPDF